MSLEEIMAEIQYNYSLSIGVMLLWNVTFKDNIDLLAGTNNELQELTNQLDKSVTRYVKLLQYTTAFIIRTEQTCFQYI